MRRALTFGTLLAALPLIAWTSAASAQDRTPVGEVCVQHNGVFFPEVYVTLTGPEGPRREHRSLRTGQTHCTPFMNTDNDAYVEVLTRRGESKDCQFSVKGRTGRLMVFMSGIVGSIQLTCP